MPTTLTANQLRAFAERADSRRGRNVYFVRDTASGAVDIVDSLKQGQELLFVLRTEDADPPFVPRPDIVLSSTPELVLDKFPDQGIDKCDAVFTSLVAFEKFVMPYYARFCTGAEIAEMRAEFCKRPEALAVAHIPDSIETLATNRGMTATNDSAALYILHLPAGEATLRASPFENLLPGRVL